MKKHPTNKHIIISIGRQKYAVPMMIVKRYPINKSMLKTLSADEVFNDLVAEQGEPGVLVRGLRNKEGLTQTAFAKQIGITQANLSAIENGRRAVGKNLAKRIADEFDFDYRLFL